MGANGDGSITLAWDPNPEPVAGYIVYAGITPGVYREQFDVGDQTSFVYPIVEGQRYYFAVAAYFPGPVIGPETPWISYPAQSTGGTSPSPPPAPHPPAGHDAPKNVAPEGHSLCFEGAPVACYAAQTLVRTSSAVRSVAGTPDGTLFFVDDGSAVKVRTSDNGQTIALAARVMRRFSSVVVDPLFATTGRVYVGEVDLAARGGPELSIVRHRDVRGRLGEGAAFVSGLPVPDDRGAPFSVDGAGGVYVAMPAGASGQERRLAPYAGSILRFDADGRVPSERRLASPVVAEGFEEPSALGLDPATGELLVGGRRFGGLAQLARFDAAQALLQWRAPLAPIPDGGAAGASAAAQPRSPASEDGSVLMLAPGNQVFRYVASRAGRRVELVAVSAGEWVTAVSTGVHGGVYLGVAHGNGEFSIVRLEPGTR